jgi:hypothetical protein
MICITRGNLEFRAEGMLKGTCPNRLLDVLDTGRLVDHGSFGLSLLVRSGM